MPQPPTSGLGKWLALTAALLGWMFDGMEMGLFPLIAKPALGEFFGTDEQIISRWMGIATAGFLIGAAAGGVLFGWLGDRIGRVRAMTLSVLTYALVTGLCAFAEEAWQVVVLRFLAALGMGGEWSLGVALVNEIWPGRSRAFLAGLIGAAANVGFMMSGASSKLLRNIAGEAQGFLESIQLPSHVIDQLMANDRWRLLMIVGASPALLACLIRLVVPESQRWEHERSKGATSHWASRDLLGVLVGSVGAIGIVYLWVGEQFSLPLRIVGSILGFLIVLAGFLYPVMQYLVRAQAADGPAEHRLGPTLRRMLLGAALSGVALIGTWGVVQWVSLYTAKLVEERELAQLQVVDPNITLKTLTDDQKAAMNRVTGPARESAQIWSAIGAIVFSILAALLSDWIGRRISYFIICALSFGSILLLFQTHQPYGPMYLALVFLMGGICSMFYGWLPLYLPELFRTSVRATGQGFCYNFGRVLAAIGAVQTGNLFPADGKASDYAAAYTVMSLVYVIGMVIIWFAPETKGKPLPE